MAFIKESGAFLAEVSPAANNGVFERLRAVLHDGELEKRTQYMIETLFQIRKDGYENYPVVQEELDLVDEEDYVTHMTGLDDKFTDDKLLNYFVMDPDYEANEEKYDLLKKEILGDSDDEEEDDSEAEEEADDEEEEEEDEEEEAQASTSAVRDLTGTELATLRKKIYLTVMSTMSIDEIVHKLVKLSRTVIEIPEGLPKTRL